MFISDRFAINQLSFSGFSSKFFISFLVKILVLYREITQFSFVSLLNFWLVTLVKTELLKKYRIQ